MTFETLVVLLALLWIADMMETLKLTSKLGNDVELNPFVRFLIKQNKKEFVLFKLVDLIVVVLISLFVYAGERRLGLSLLMSFITLYIFVVVHNYRIYKKYCV